MKEKNDLVFIEHILDSINAIEDFTKHTKKNEFLSNRLKQSAVVREIEIVGEAVKNISEKLKDKHKGIEWKAIVGTRDKMINHYFWVDFNIVWEIIRKDMPELKQMLLKIKEKLN